MPEEPTRTLPAPDVLRSMLQGVRVEYGSLVSFRDEPAFEMVMRLNQRHKGKLVAAVLTKTEVASDKRDDWVTSSSAEARMIFVPELYEALLDEEMQKWLDPFRSRNEGRKERRRGDTDSSDDGGDAAEDYYETNFDHYDP
ncbi:hypothetical protein ERJ75_000945900 [Trypanosoma vivax]|uniref:Uncharacterized protein n=1 Tax=Trypanosoma vivax (strain Y486) TaxID=1055687 RepID=G0U4F8_TRYVY|nr:hypothetical protein TRVL_05534 [Trypanosoma vivax]KAH8611203.1 hypothetical protein ERJ75_000945900 [Trypanosoma vivax]CCC52322.1 conserved hypothetical protein [Trypanosoma vivax Y486]